VRTTKERREARKIQQREKKTAGREKRRAVNPVTDPVLAVIDGFLIAVADAAGDARCGLQTASASLASIQS